MVLEEKLTFFHVLIFGKIRTENVFEDILERKRAFLDSKIRKLNKSKNQDFSNGFGKKIEMFTSFLLLAKSASTMCLTMF